MGFLRQDSVSGSGCRVSCVGLLGSVAGGLRGGEPQKDTEGELVGFWGNAEWGGVCKGGQGGAFNLL
jgi:hypothetical protein